MPVILSSCSVSEAMSDNDTTARRGRLAEERAARFLEERKLTVIARNHRCGGGEIDLICRDGRTLVFVEVRLRRNGGFGGAAASITPAKQRRIVLAARHYLATTGKHRLACRFDCVLLDGENIEWVKNAFFAP
jgi:putative endonuclease